MINPSFLTHITPILADFFAQDVRVNNFLSVGGGDINSAYKLSLNCGDVFVKMNDALRFPELFESEKEGLELLKKKSSFLVPKPIKTGVYVDQTYLLLEFIPMERGGNWGAFGSALAKMHQVSASQFGLGRSNYIGSLVQENTAKDSWADFYSELRLYPLMKKIINRGLLTFDDGKRLDALVREIPSIYPEEKPSLLHGDLWSGNAAFSRNLPCIYDPAVYYGHREMDIAMTYLFGGFPDEMLVSYNSLYPLGGGWRERMEISQLYPLMVHSLLFGGNYTRQVKEILKRF